ncbi:MAG: phenylacetate--CoA ligase, partial [Fuerstiella sp.]|nr:phenylacetate--CoA ligase [Fuerstiella sp.]
LTHANQWYGQLRGYDRVGIAAQVNGAMKRSSEEIRHQQLADFRAIVVSSAERFPFYADRLRERLGGVPGVRDEFVPSDLPLWTKDDQRTFFASLRPSDFGSCFLHSSGGSTGVPIQFYMTRKSFEWRTAVARRSYSFASAEPGRRAFFVWGDAAIQPPVHVRLKTRLSQWVENR